jgi:hypothetical protein
MANHRKRRNSTIKIREATGSFISLVIMVVIAAGLANLCAFATAQDHQQSPLPPIGVEEAEKSDTNINLLAMLRGERMHMQRLPPASGDWQDTTMFVVCYYYYIEFGLLLIFRGDNSHFYSHVKIKSALFQWSKKLKISF